MEVERREAEDDTGGEKKNCRVKASKQASRKLFGAMSFKSLLLLGMLVIQLGCVALLYIENWVEGNEEQYPHDLLKWKLQYLLSLFQEYSSKYLGI